MDRVGGHGGSAKRPLISTQMAPENKRSRSKYSNFQPLLMQPVIVHNTNTTNATEDSANTTHVSNIPTQNRFTVNGNPLDKIAEDIHMEGDGNSEEVKVSATSSAASKKVAPIIVAGSNATTIQNMLSTVVTSKKYEMKITSIGIRINLKEQNDFANVKAKLKEMADAKEINGFYNYHTAETRPHKIVLFGLHKMSNEEIKKVLKDNNVNPTDVTQLRLGDRPGPQAAYLLYFAPGTTKLADLRKIKHIDSIIVRWERFEPKRQDKVPQCRNCQMYGHSSVNCNMPTRCLVCGSDHKTEVCPKKISRAAIQHMKATGVTVKRDFIKCANCGENHTASFKGCIARKAFIDKQSNGARKVQARRPAQPSRNVVFNESDFPQPSWAEQLELPQSSHQFQSYSDTARQHQPPHSSTDQQMQIMIRMMETMERLMARMDSMFDLMVRHQTNNRQNHHG